MELQEIRDKIELKQAALNMQKYMANIKSQFSNYEERESQKNMIRAIIKSFQMGEHAIIEAPTGTGKSLAYLLAFLSIWEQFKFKLEDGEVIERKPKLCIATNTIALQEQLFEKDIPTFQKMIGVDFKTALIKGRSNYICNRNFMDIVKNPDKGSFTSLEETVEFNKLTEEVLDSKDNFIVGDRSLLKDNVSQELWNKVSTDSQSCTKRDCPFYDTCNFYEAKKENANADVIITNHALFFADLGVKIETGFEMQDLVLPAFDFVVFDEAHNLEDVASDYLGDSGHYRGFMKFINEFKNALSKGELGEKLAQNPEIIQELLNALNEAEVFTLEFFKTAIDLTNDYVNGKTSSIRRLNQPMEYLVGPALKLKGVLKEITETIDFIFENEEIVELLGSEQRTKITLLRSRASNMGESVRKFATQSEDEHVYWIEAPEKYKSKTIDPAKRHEFVSYHTVPISVNNVLKENLFDRLESVVLTSATLGTDNLNYIASRLGIDRYISKMFFSPFNYEKQSILHIPENTVSVKDNQNYEKYVEEEVKQLITMSEGRALVLFTSYYMLKNVANNVEAYIEGLGYTVLKQGDLPRTPLINKFREDEKSVLFATSSYWEGIDVQGDALTNVIITKLPFDVPDQPVIQARMEHINRSGGNAFMQYQVPTAIMKFKQGFGRLIRSTNDKGVVTVLDDRIIKMRYGQQFLNSLPPIRISRHKQEIAPFFDIEKEETRV